MKTKRFLCLLIAMVLCLSTFAAFAEVNPAEEIFVTAAPVSEEEIDYSDAANRAYWDEGEDKSADLFFVCPTVDMGKDGNFNADIENEKYRESFVGAINMELGIYNDDASVYAPFYRQATFPVYSLSKEEQEEYLSLYAVPAMQYVVGSGFITGRTKNTLNPKDSTTRAEMAVIIEKFIRCNTPSESDE